MKKLRVIFIGLHHPHVAALYRAIKHREDAFEVLGYADVPPYDGDKATKEKRERMFAENGVAAFEDWRELIALKPDLAVVNSDNASRCEVCCTLLRAGVNVIDEKPMARTFAEAAAMVSCAEENGVHMLTNWPVAWLPAFRMAKRLVDEGRIGRPMRVVYRSPATWGPFSYRQGGQNPPNEELMRSWWYHDDRGGGAILDYACYGTLLATWIFGKQAERVSAIRKNFTIPESDIEDYSAMILDFGDGVGLLEGSWSTFNPGEIPTGPVVYGSEGVIVCDRYSGVVKVYIGNSHQPVEPTEVIELEENQQEFLLGESLLRVLRDGEESDILLGAKFNLEVVAALDAGRRSADTGAAVKTETID